MGSLSSIILIVRDEFDTHADYVAEKCQQLGARVVSFAIDDYFLNSELNFNISDSHISLAIKNKTYDLTEENIRSIYARDFHVPKIPLESSLPNELVYAEKRSALYGFFKGLNHKFRINNPWKDEFADNKTLQLMGAKEVGLKIPRSLITNSPSEFLKFYDTCNGEVIIKQLSEICLIDDSELGTEAEDPKAYGFYTRKVSPNFIKDVEQIKNAPCCFQEFIPKVADIRSTVVGKEVFSALIKSQNYRESKIDFRMKEDIPMEEYFLPVEIQNKLLALLKKWDLEFSACDFALTKDNELVFFEANVAGNWLWIEDALDFPISKTIAKKIVAD